MKGKTDKQNVRTKKKDSGNRKLDISLSMILVNTTKQKEIKSFLSRDHS